MKNIFETDPARKLYPKYIFSRVKIQRSIETFFYKIDYSSGYFLRRMMVKIPNFCRDATLPAWTPGAAIAANAKYTPSAAWKAANPGANLIIQNGAAPGVTAGAEPVWPRTFGIAVVDNTANWTTKTAFDIQAPRLNFSIYDCAHQIARQAEPVPADLIGTPAQERAFLQAAPAPVDTDIFGLNWNTPNPPTMSASLNWIYKYADTIKIEITGQTQQAITTGTMWTPDYIDLFLIGYYLPTGTLQNG